MFSHKYIVFIVCYKTKVNYYLKWNVICKVLDHFTQENQIILEYVYQAKTHM